MTFELLDPINVIAILAGILVAAICWPDDGDDFNPPFRKD